MKRVIAQPVNIPLDDAPKVSVEYVEARLKQKKRLSEMPEFLAFLNAALANYWRQKARDEVSATPARVRDLVRRMERVAADLEPRDGVEATILRAVVSPFEFADCVGKIEELTAKLKGLEADVGLPRKSSGERLLHARQLELAREFWAAFEAKNWPLETSSGSLMAQLLLAVLKAAGEGRGTINRLLEAARPEHLKSAVAD